MANEIELKLALPETARRAFLSHPALAAANGKTTRQLANIYYDTPDLALRKSGIALRLRRQGRTWLQTVKGAGSSAGGLSARSEWETAYDGQFDFFAIDDAAVRRRLAKSAIRSRLMPIFETRYRRTTWTVDGLLLMFDRGWIVAGGKREAISELELELAGANVADVAALFELAERLANDLPLMPALLSKADRGVRLHLGIAPTPYRAAAVALSKDTAPLAAFRAIALSCLDHIQHNHAGAIGTDDPEYIHQMRVGARRLRACLRLFAPCLPEGFVAAFTASLRELLAPLGAVRDLDVLLAEIAAPVTAALPGEPRLAALTGIIAERRLTARRAAVRALAAQRFGPVLLHATALLHTGQLTEAASTDSARDFAAARLKKLRRRVRQLAQHAEPGDPASLHALRIGVKRLRYALEFFAPLARRKSRRRLADRLAATQDVLGRLNDLANAGHLLMDCAGHDERLREAVTLIGGWHGSHHARLMKRLPKMIARLSRLAR
jgi:inorganic triphosphatase YgiF